MICSIVVGTSGMLNIDIDVRTITTILAINLGIFKIKNSGLVQVDEFLNVTYIPPDIVKRGHFYVDVKFIQFL